MKPYLKGNLVICPIGRSVIIPGSRKISIQLPYKIIGRTVLLAGMGNLSQHLEVIPVWKESGKPLRFTIKNLSQEPQQLGSKAGIVAFHTHVKNFVFRTIEDEECIIGDKIEKICQVREMQNVEFWVNKYPKVFSDKLHGVKHYIIENIGQMDGSKWSSLKIRHYSTMEMQVLRPLVQEFIDAGVVEISPEKPTVITPLITVPKKDGNTRLVLDFRLLNASCKEVQGLPMDRSQVLNSVPHKKIWTTFDLSKGFLQIPLAKHIRHLFGFELDSKFYRFKRAPFGWVNSMQHFTWALAYTIKRIKDRLSQGNVILVYVDDVAVGSDTEKEHANALNIIMEELARDGWVLHRKKISLFEKKLDFLGRSFSTKIQVDSGLIHKMTQIKRPKSAKDLRSFLGLVLQINHFQYNQHHLLKDLLSWKKRKSEDFNSKEFEILWNNTIKKISKNCFNLGYCDYNAKLSMLVDSSAHGCGAILFSGQCPVAMFSAPSKEWWRHSTELEIEGLL